MIDIKEKNINIDVAPLQQRTVVVVGLGALGSAVAHTVTPFVKTIILVDHDKVEPKNSSNQYLHPVSNVNLLKVYSANKTLLNHFPHTRIIPIPDKIQNIHDSLVKNYREISIVFDCVDNSETRQFIYSSESFLDKYIVHLAISHNSYQYAIIQPQDKETRKIFSEMYALPKQKNSDNEPPCHIARNIFASYSCVFDALRELTLKLRERE